MGGRGYQPWRLRARLESRVGTLAGAGESETASLMNGRKSLTVSRPGLAVWPNLILIKVAAGTPEKRCRRSTWAIDRPCRALTTSATEGMSVCMMHNLPRLVTEHKPHLASKGPYRARMRKKIKQVLGENAVALSAHRNPLRPNEKGTTRLMQCGLTNGSAQRVLTGETDVGLSVVETIANGLRVEPWQLLVPNFHPDRLPQLAAETTQSSMAHEVARWLDEAAPGQRDELYALWNSVRVLVAQGLLVQITAGLSAAASQAADSPAPSATRGRNR